jgi:hypothetical protein
VLALQGQQQGIPLFEDLGDYTFHGTALAAGLHMRPARDYTFRGTALATGLHMRPARDYTFRGTAHPTGLHTKAKRVFMNAGYWRERRRRFGARARPRRWAARRSSARLRLRILAAVSL